jgi:UrcA family protein
MLRPLTFACASALALAIASPSFAQEEIIVTAPPTIQGHERRVVQYGDLDLNDERGAYALVQRLERAARAVCGDGETRLPLPDERNASSCTRETLDTAIADVNHPYVNARYYGYWPPQHAAYEPSYYGPKG